MRWVQRAGGDLVLNSQERSSTVSCWIRRHDGLLPALFFYNTPGDYVKCAKLGVSTDGGWLIFSCCCLSFKDPSEMSIPQPRRLLQPNLALACRSPGLSDRQCGVQPICNNNDRHTSRMRGYDFGLSVIRTFASKNAACFSLILRTSAGWLKFFTFLEARARCSRRTCQTTLHKQANRERKVKKNK